MDGLADKAIPMYYPFFERASQKIDLLYKGCSGSLRTFAVFLF